MSEVIEDVPTFVSDLGLHDVRVLRVAYESDAPVLAIEVEDLNWNHEGEPGYRPRRCRLIFSAIEAFVIQAGQDRFHTSVLGEGTAISDAYAITKLGVTRLDIVMSTSERWYVEFGQLEIEDIG